MISTDRQRTCDKTSCKTLFYIFCWPCIK